MGTKLSFTSSCSWKTRDTDCCYDVMKRSGYERFGEIGAVEVSGKTLFGAGRLYCISIVDLHFYLLPLGTSGCLDGDSAVGGWAERSGWNGEFILGRM
jgi:hypothetical protein